MKDTCSNGMTDVEDFAATRLSVGWGESASTKIGPRSGQTALVRNYYSFDIKSITNIFITSFRAKLYSFYDPPV